MTESAKKISDMDPESNITRSALKFIIGESNNICRLCFAPTNDEQILFSVSVTGQQSFFDETVTFLEMLDDLGVPKEPLLPQGLCANCATNTINSYLYFRQWQYTHEKWKKILKNLEDNLTQSEALSRNRQTAYLMMNEKENFVVTSFRRKPIRNKTLAMLKLRSVLSNKEKYEKKKQKCREINCIECGVTCKSKKELLGHRLRMHKGSTRQQVGFHSCSQCTKLFTSQKDLDMHVSRLHLPKTIQCPQCPSMFSTNKLLKMHTKIQHETYRCGQCNIELHSYPAIRKHLETHSEHKCSKCNKTLKSRNSMKEHLKICGRKRSECVPTVFCDICCKGYGKKSSLEQHMKTDHGYGPSYACKWCNKRFNAPSTLKCHIVKHTGERNFSCEECGGHFVTQAALTYHIRLHTGERPYECEVCGERFINTSRRAEHKRKKHLAPQFQCSICLMKFSLNRSMKKHMIRHNNPRSKMYMV